MNVNVNKVFIAFMLVTFVVSITSCSTVSSTSNRVEIQNNNGGKSRLDNGFAIEVPPGALSSSDSKLEITMLDTPPDGNVDSSSTFEIVGEAYDINLDNGTPFKKPVTLEIPYEPDKIPANHHEEEIFPVFYENGQWIRTTGTVDTNRKVILVLAHHNSIWAPMYDSNNNWDDPNSQLIKDWLSAETNDPQALEKAKQEVERRRSELRSILAQADWEINELEEQLSPESIQNDIKWVTVKVGTKSWLALLEAWGGKSAIISIAGVPVIKLVGYVTTPGYAIYRAFRINLEAGDVLYYMTQIEYASKRLEEAEAIVWGLEHPWAQTIDPISKQYLDTYYQSLPIDETISPSKDWDFQWSAYNISIDDDTPIEPATTEEPTITITPTYTPSPVVASCTLQQIDIEGIVNYISSDGREVGVEITMMNPDSSGQGYTLDTSDGIWRFIDLDGPHDLAVGSQIRVVGFLQIHFVSADNGEEIRGVTLNYEGCQGGYIKTLDTSISPPPDDEPNSSGMPFFMTRLVTEEDLAGKSQWELDIMRNEIYARYGRGFNREDLQIYFNSQPWYKKIYEPADFPDELLTYIQKRNAEFIYNYQQ